MSLILIVGATGNVGGMATRQLLQRGHTVRILARPGSLYQPLVEAGAQPVMGDLKDRASLDAACQGVEVVITTANTTLRGGDDNVQTVDLDGTRNLIDAAKSARVKQFIYVSALGADPNSHAPVAQAKGKNENHLRASGMPYTIIAPVPNMEVFPMMVVGLPAMKSQPVMFVGEGHRKHSFISASDVALFVVEAVNNPKAMKQYLAVGGPESLSWRDIVAIYERLLGRGIPIKSLKPGERVPYLSDLMNAVLPIFDMIDMQVDTTETARTFNVTLTPFEQVARRMLASELTPAH